MMTDSILDSVKQLLGIDPAYTEFDMNVAMNINATLAILQQFQIGPEEGLVIIDNTAKWSDLIPPEHSKQLSFIPMYVYIKVKLVFDPTTSSTETESLKSVASEFEQRILMYQSYLRSTENEVIT